MKLQWMYSGQKSGGTLPKSQSTLLPFDGVGYHVRYHARISSIFVCFVPIPLLFSSLYLFYLVFLLRKVNIDNIETKIHN